ncbi:MAG: OB-fold domain-containing protein, partial [Patescibacteria group bacterium]
MIAHLSGTVHFRGTKFLIVDVGGVGYKVTTSLET